MINTADPINAWIKANDVSLTDYQIARLQDAVRELVKQWVAQEEEAMMAEYDIIDMEKK
ncbi:MAG: hypothetical protein ABFD60_07945 [Bryobacteraceae bacterium]